MITSAPTRIAAAFALSLGIAGTAFADSSHQPAITEARAEGGVLHIGGLYFGSAKPKVTLGTLPLSVIAATASAIDAVLPSTVAPGSYLLTVALTKGRNDDHNDDGKYDEFWVTIGAGGVAGKDGAPGKDGSQGAQGPPGKDGAPGPAGRVGEPGVPGKDGAPGRDGAQGATGPQGPAGTGGSLSTIDSIAGLPCTVAMCAGTTAITFDPSTSLARLSCARAPGTNTLRIQGSAAIGPMLVKDTLRYTSDVPGFAGDIVTRDAQHNYVGFDIPAGNLCSGQLVSLTVIRSGANFAGLTVQGGSCTPARSLQPLGGGDYSATCTFTMSGDQTLTLQ